MRGSSDYLTSNRYFSRYRVIIRLLISLTLLVILSGCRHEPSNILETSACDPPCWRGINPGTSSVNEVIAQLELMSEVKDFRAGSLYTDGELDTVTWEFNSGIAECLGRSSVSEEVVSIIEIYACNAITLGEVVAKFGEPDQVSVIASSFEIRWLSIGLLYPERGLAVVAIDEGRWPLDKPGRISEDQRVSHIYFFDPGLYEDLLRRDSFLRVGACEDDILSSLQPWRGFGEVAFFDMSQSRIYCP